MDRLDVLVERLRRWNAAINLIAPSTLGEIWVRHIFDSGQLHDLAPRGARSWVDLGAGAGLPGLVVAAIAAERRPELHVTMIESDGRKAVFIAEAARAMNVQVTVERRRIEESPKARYDVVSARALAALDRLIPMAAPYLSERGVMLFPKGRSAEEELTVAAASWHMKVERHVGLADPSGLVLSLTEVARADP
ncbi:MAG: 16S rRNA (guanine(527)-N(7))-methyltransferase RsmG [Rubrimonas sp.]